MCTLWFDRQEKEAKTADAKISRRSGTKAKPCSYFGPLCSSILVCL